MVLVTLLASAGIIALVGCNHQGFLHPEEQSAQARGELERGEFTRALETINQGVQRYQRSQPDWAWRFRVLNAEVLVWQGKTKDALALLEDEPPSHLSSDEAAVRRKIVQGVANYHLQNFDEASLRLSEAEHLASSEQPGLLGDVATARGTLLALRGNYREAAEFQRRALGFARRQGRLFLEANVLGNLGFIALRQQHYGEAIDWLVASLRISQRIGNQMLDAKTLGNLGWCYYRIGDFESALTNITKAESISSRLSAVKDQLLWLNSIALIRYDQRDFDHAKEDFHRALSIARKLENRSAVAMCLDNLTLASVEANDFDSAQRYLDEALEIYRAIKHDPAELYSLQNKALILAEKGRFDKAEELLKEIIRDSADNVSLRWASETQLAKVYAAQRESAKANVQFRRALTTVDKARASLKEEYRLSFLTTAEHFYDEYIDFLITRGRTKEALQVAEHSRARTLAEGLKLPPSALGGAFRPEETARKLNAVILSYWLKPGQSYLWTVTPAKVELYRLPSGSEIDNAVSDYRKELMGPRDVRESSTGQKLYQMLVAPAQKLIKPGSRVLIISDGSLNGLNFETLLAPGSQPHYWIEDVIVSNASSIALAGAGAGNIAPKTRNLLLIGDPVYTGSSYPALPQAKQEIQQVAGQFAPGDRLVLDGQKATPSAFAASNAGRFSYVHLVAHATASRISPLDSSIVLTNEGDVQKLYARDIMQQPLRADLVTISACYGAGSRSYSGEGLVGLSWAFLRAGARNVVAGLWEVNDASTPQLMNDFYGELQKGRDPAVALRSAKLRMLRSDTVYRRPFYWAVFQLYTGS